MDDLQRLDLFPTPIWTVDLVEFEPLAPAMIAAARRALDQHPAPEMELFRQSRAVLQDDSEPAWIDFFRVLARLMEGIVSDQIPIKFGFDAAFLRSWVLEISDPSEFLRTGSTLNALHSHIPSVLSSVLYLQVPDALIDAPSGGTTFRDPNSVNTRMYGRPEFHVSPAPLRLVIFPSYLEHCPEQPAPGLVMDTPRLAVSTDLRVNLQ